MTDRNATPRARGRPRVQSVRYRPETQARALLRLVAPVAPLDYGDLDLPGSDRHAHRRARAAVQACADRRAFGDPGRSYRDRCRAALRDLRRIADVDRDAFALECAAVDALECAAMHAAMERIAPQQGPTRPPAPAPTAIGPRDLERMQALYDVETGKIDNLLQLTDHRANAQTNETA